MASASRTSTHGLRDGARFESTFRHGATHGHDPSTHRRGSSGSSKSGRNATVGPTRCRRSARSGAATRRCENLGSTATFKDEASWHPAQSPSAERALE